MVLQIQKTKITLVSNPPKLNHLPTFSPNEEYIQLLLSLQKERNKKDNQDSVKVKNLNKRLSNIEATLTPDEIIFNNRIAYANIKPTKL